MNYPLQNSTFASLSGYGNLSPSVPSFMQGVAQHADFSNIASESANNFLANTVDVSGGGGFMSGLGDMFGGFLQQRNADGTTSGGWGTAALGIAQGLGNAYMGMQQYGLAKKALAQSKDQFEKNYAAQRQTTNASLEDRQRARVASNPGAYQSVGDYMAQNGIR